MKFLIIDFNEDFKPIYERKLCGFRNAQLKVVTSQRDAVKFLGSFNPDCILVNYLLEKTYNFYNFFRASGFKGDIIILTPGKEKRIKRNYYNGITGILDKYLNTEDFQLKLQELLDKNVPVCNTNRAI